MNKNKKIQLFLNMLVLASGLLAFFSWIEYDKIQPIATAIWSAFYKTIQTYIFGADLDTHEIPLGLKVAVILAPMSIASSILFSIIRYIRSRFFGLFLNLFSRNHIIIAGSPDFCYDLINKGKSVPNRKVIFLSSEFEHQQLTFNDSKITIIYGDLENPKDWNNLGIRHASNLILGTQYADSLDEIKTLLHPFLKSRKRPLEINYALETQAQREICAESKRWLSDKVFDAHSFQISSMAAAVAVEKFAPHHFISTSKLSKEPVHIVIDGFNQFCPWFLLEAIHLYHYPSFKKLKLTIIIDNSAELDDFFNQYPGVLRAAEISHFLRKDIQDNLHFCEKNINGFLDIPPDMVLSFPSEPWAIPSSARLWRRWGVINKNSATLPIKFFLPENYPNKETFKSFDKEYLDLDFQVYSPEDFISLDHIIENREVIDSIAQAIHDSYASRYGAVAWNQLNDLEKDYNRRAARHLRVKLNLLGYDFSDKEDAISVEIPGFTRQEKSIFARLEHQRWNTEKILLGFIPGIFPQDKNEKNYFKNILRIHQDIRPFEQLTKEDISKDENTFEDLRWILDYVLKKQKFIKIENPEG
ncbi:MAG: hypothetical protein JXR63_09300 [Spirochaetales bacterium]|nr:hypothetical protein [Spirochaetales bacterium]